ncbi:protein kinase domain-containing protein [Leucobacter sp. Z1108]|uniref:protein kinase domain-containing protein n=1 Tax=Leucobacter sp. Z1108 TaxID=3439066 RepID=UPI003F39F0DF
MKRSSPLWRVMGDPAQAQEAAALERVCVLLPEDGIARAWANVTFTDTSGRLNEVDVLLITSGGMYVVELKGWHGEIRGDQRNWTHAGRTERNPRLLANDKAKRLASVLKDVASKARLNPRIVPFVGEAIVLHGQDSKVQLDEYGAEQVWALDGFRVNGLGDDQNFSSLVSLTSHRDPIDAVRANEIDRLMKAAGLMPRAKQRTIGQYALDSSESLDEGNGWQDFLVTHPQAKTKRRIRLFAYPKGASKESRSEVDRRAAREFRLTDGIRHPGIIGPADMLSTEEGSALVFDFDPNESSLADYLTQHGDTLTFADREAIVQDLAELVRFAHGQRLTHRALSPRSVRIHSGKDGTREVRIRDWDLGKRPDEGTTTATLISRGVTDVVASVDQDALFYLAPETLKSITSTSPQPLDVYGVGALAFLVLTNKSPAVNFAALEALLNSDAKGLDPRAVLPEISDAYADVIVNATAFAELHRTIDIGVLLDDLSMARSAERGPEPIHVDVDPLESAPGDIVDDRFEIIKRRGSGSTGVALEVNDYSLEREGLILKLAKDDSAASRLDNEAAVLDRLNHPRIVKRVEGPLSVGNRRAIVMTDAGNETLADRIRLEGRATIEQLERYGDDLFSAIAHLEEQGVFHRDIKPSNLAVKPDPGTRKPHLTLFDFSLSDEPVANVKSGSKPYLDPYLGSRARPQYDSAAERFSIAATLFELATADAVWWETGDQPAKPTDPPVVSAAQFEPSISDALVQFFRTAFEPAAAKRHPSLSAMRQAWADALNTADAEDADFTANDEKAGLADLSTPLTDAGLSARALSALARVDATTVAELLGVPPVRINQIRGLGEQVRREISSRIREWRKRLSSATSTVESELIPGRRPVERIFGVASQKLNETDDEWRERLRKQGALKQPLSDISLWLRELGNVASSTELAAKLLREYGSTLNDGPRQDAAKSVIDAIIRFDMRAKSPRLLAQKIRNTGETVVAYTSDDEEGLSFDEAETQLEALVRLSHTVDTLLTQSDIVSGSALREALARSNSERLVLPGIRVSQLAIGLSQTGRISSMGEAYRKDLTPERAVETALRGAATRELALVTIEQRVKARFPEAAEIPTRPQLDEAVRSALPHLEWLADSGKYVLREANDASSTYTASTTSIAETGSDPALAAKLASSIRDHGALVLASSVRHRTLDESAGLIATGYGVRIIDLADLILDALKRTAESNRVPWETVLRADAEPDGTQDRRNLLQLARMAVVPLWRELMESEDPLLLVNSAVLARLGLTDLIAQVCDLATSRVAARWFLLARPPSGRTPDLDGVPMPVGADGWTNLPLELPMFSTGIGFVGKAAAK